MLAISPARLVWGKGAGPCGVAGREFRPVEETIRTVIPNTEPVAEMARCFGLGEDVKMIRERFSLRNLPLVLPLVVFGLTSIPRLRLDSRAETVGVSV